MISHPIARPFVRIAKEPLFQFLLLGGLLFLADRYVVSKQDNPRSILVDQARRTELAAIFEEGQGRAPSPKEMQELIVKWTQNEVLYREALQMKLDQGDDMIRQRLILKIRNVLFNNIVTQAPRDEQLRQWFEQRRNDYDQPETFDVEQFQITKAHDAEAAEAVARALGSGDVPEEQLDQVRHYERRPPSNLSFLFGEEGASRLAGAEVGQWLVVRSEQGWHAARVTARHPAEPADFDKVRNRILREWRDASKKADLSGALRDIVEQYDIRVVGDDRPTPGATLSKLSLTPGRGAEP